MLYGVSYLARTRPIDRIVALDDFDLEKAALLREHLRTPGMGESTTRYFRDKLAMRMEARDHGVLVPEFVPIFHHGRVAEFLDRVRPPWVLKPRSLAGAIGIRKLHEPRAVWEQVEALGDQQSFYLLEQFVPGDVYHCDSLVYEGQIRFACVSRYGAPPMQVSHEGGVFTTRLVERGSAEERAVLEVNAQVLRALRMKRGVNHTEFIRARDTGEVFFLETSARVGGAHIAELVEAATGLNLWAEWAKIEIAGGRESYALPSLRHDYAGLVVSLARQPWPDTSGFNDPEIVWRLHKEHHIGLIVRSPDPQRVEELLNRYVERIQQDYQAVLPPRESPSE
jgi:biotin carboxylase